MHRPLITTLLLAMLAGPALAQSDLPAMVGRIAAVQGNVTLTGNDDSVPAGLNWPVLAGNHLHTASGARSEFRAGSSAVRLDGDSDLEIVELDDDVLRLRLNYGSVSIRLRQPELLRNFELITPQARITLLEPGVLRVDAERLADTSQISVLAGSARVNGAGASLTLASGRQAEVNSNDVRTGLAHTDGFDRWAEERDRVSEAPITTRFVSSGITGYEELDRNGSWSDSVEYGPLWTPRNVSADWAPYRDGRWIFLAPWGWTWIDNAPWGYAPSHYGRWVMINRRWCWAPGRPAGRPVWAPALVGWVDGHGSGPGHRPGKGWYPLSPRDHFVPDYRVSPDHERRLNWRDHGRPLPALPLRNGQPPRHDGLSVLPREQFERPVRGPNTQPANQPGVSPIGSVPAVRPLDTQRQHWPERGQESRSERWQDGRNERWQDSRNERPAERPGSRGDAPLRTPGNPVQAIPAPAAPAAVMPAQLPAPSLAPQPGNAPPVTAIAAPERNPRPGRPDYADRNDGRSERWERIDRGDRFERPDQSNRGSRSSDDERRSLRTPDERRTAPATLQAQPSYQASPQVTPVQQMAPLAQPARMPAPMPTPAMTPARPAFSPPAMPAPAPAAAAPAPPKESGQHQREERRKEEGRDRDVKGNQNRP